MAQPDESDGSGGTAVKVVPMAATQPDGYKLQRGYIAANR